MWYENQLLCEVTGKAAGWGRRNLRKGMPQSTRTTPTRAGKGSCIRIRKASSTDSTMKVIGAIGNHQPRTGSLSRKSVEAASAREKDRGENR